MAAPHLPPAPGKHHGLKAFLIAVACTVALLAIVVGLLAYGVWRSIMIAFYPSASDLAEMQRLRDERAAAVAKIAKFSVPPGYAILNVLDGSVTIVRYEHGQNDFEMQLSSQDVPVIPGLDDGVDVAQLQKKADEMSEVAFGSMGKLLANCKFVALPDDVVPILGADVRFTVRGCAGAVRKPAYERGTFAQNGHRVSVEAMGFKDFDVTALHELLRSIR